MKKSINLNDSKLKDIAREKAKYFAHEFGLFHSRPVKFIHIISFKDNQNKLQLNPDNLMKSFLELNLN